MRVRATDKLLYILHFLVKNSRKEKKKKTQKKGLCDSGWMTVVWIYFLSNHACVQMAHGVLRTGYLAGIGLISLIDSASYCPHRSPPESWQELFS